MVAALGRRGERSLGLQTIEVDSIVGTVDRSREFDRSFRPTTQRVRTRWERIALTRSPPARGTCAHQAGTPPAFAGLAEGVEAWGFRHMQACGQFWENTEIRRLRRELR